MFFDIIIMVRKTLAWLSSANFCLGAFKGAKGFKPFEKTEKTLESI
jgi:hypothetical protein